MPVPYDQWPTADPVLAAFAEDLRTITGGPAPEPRPRLVAVMRQGDSLPTDPPPGRRKMLVRTLVGTLTAKLALGVGVAAASMTAAGAAGVLPDPAQHAVASVVDVATPFALPEPSTTIPQVKKDATKPAKATAAEDDDDADDAATAPGDDKGGTRAENHGACVSTAAKALAGTGAGKTVSSVARSDCGKTDASTSTTSTTVITSTTTSTTVAGSENRNPGSGPGSSNSGKGNSANSGKGKTGKD